MKKFVLLIISVFTVFALCACGKSDTPEGMQLVYGGKAAGYYFYAPEEWTVSNVGEIKSAYASRVDSSSMSFAKIDVAKANTTEKSDEEYFFTEYFTDSLAEFPTAPEVTVNGEKTDFGAEKSRADKALRYVYNYEYSGHKFGFLQIFMTEGEDFYIFTYSALLEERSDGKTYYDYYKDKLTSVMENFKFTERSEESGKAPEYKKDKDGYILVSNSELSGFELYVPDKYAPDFSSAIVSATHEDGTNINMTEAVSTGVAVSDYWKNRKAELEALTGSTVTEIKVNEKAKLGNADAAFSYEYTFDYNGEKYHVYQVLAIEGPLLMQKGYVLTFTAKETNYEKHSAELKSIIEKVKFK